MTCSLTPGSGPRSGGARRGVCAGVMVSAATPDRGVFGSGGPTPLTYPFVGFIPGGSTRDAATPPPPTTQSVLRWLLRRGLRFVAGLAEDLALGELSRPYLSASIPDPGDLDLFRGGVDVVDLQAIRGPAFGTGASVGRDPFFSAPSPQLLRVRVVIVTSAHRPLAMACPSQIPDLQVRSGISTPFTSRSCPRSMAVDAGASCSTELSSSVLGAANETGCGTSETSACRVMPPCAVDVSGLAVSAGGLGRS